MKEKYLRPVLVNAGTLEFEGLLPALAAGVAKLVATVATIGIITTPPPLSTAAEAIQRPRPYFGLKKLQP